jgi:hypothetical protein
MPEVPWLFVLPWASFRVAGAPLAAEYEYAIHQLPKNAHNKLHNVLFY